MKLEQRATPSVDGKSWIDHLGFAGPFKPGLGPRSDPAGDFPTGPALGERLPDIRGIDQRGNPIDVHRDRAGGPLIVAFFRSAVW
jgi:hypothetical protein